MTAEENGPVRSGREDRPGSRAALWGALCVLALSPLPDWPTAHTRAWATLQDFAHGPIFAGIASLWILLWRIHGEPKAVRYRKYWAVLGLCVLLGCTIEFVQSLLGRDASVRDVINDTLGAVLGLSMTSLFDHRFAYRSHRRGISLTAALVSAALLVYPVADVGASYLNRARRMPELLTPERLRDLDFARSGSAWLEMTYLPEPWAQGSVVPTLDLLFGDGKYSGLNLFEPYPDWRGYQTLALDVTWPGAIPLPLTVRIHDRRHNDEYGDRFNRSFALEPESRQVLRIALDEIASAPQGRPLDLAHVAGLGMFIQPKGVFSGERIYVTRIWLE